MPTAEQRFVSFPNKYGPYVDTVGKNAKKIQEYIQNQLKEDYEYDQMTLRLANHFDESLDSSAGKKPL